jgi:hypothetical protein
MTTSASLFIWDAVGALHPLQFPFRFLQLVALATAFLCALPFAFFRKDKPWQANALMGVMIAVLLLFGLPHARPQSYLDLDEAQYSPDAIAAKGIPASAREFEPVAVKQFPPPTAEPTLSFPAGNGSVLAAAVTPTRQSFSVEVAKDTLVTSSTFYFPGWTLYVDGEERAVTASDPHGLAQFFLESGRHEVDLRFEATHVRAWSARLSIIAALLLFTSPLLANRILRMGRRLSGSANWRFSIHRRSRAPRPAQ